MTGLWNFKDIQNSRQTSVVKINWSVSLLAPDYGLLDYVVRKTGDLICDNAVLVWC